MRDEAELRRHHHLSTTAFDRPADQLLAVKRAIDLGSVDVGHAQSQRTVDSADRLIVVQATT